MTFVILMESGYWFSAMALLYSLVRWGAMKSALALSTAGLISKISLALWRLRVRMSWSTSSSWIGWSLNGGLVLLGTVMHSSCCCGMVRLVLCPTVM